MPSSHIETSPVSKDRDNSAKFMSGPSTACAACKSKSGIAGFLIRLWCPSGISGSTTGLYSDHGCATSSLLMFNINELVMSSPFIVRSFLLFHDGTLLLVTSLLLFHDGTETSSSASSNTLGPCNTNSLPAIHFANAVDDSLAQTFGFRDHLGFTLDPICVNIIMFAFSPVNTGMVTSAFRGSLMLPHCLNPCEHLLFMYRVVLLG